MPTPGYNPTSGGLLNPGKLGGLVQDMLARQGMSCWWYPASICSCWGDITGIDAESASPDPACPVCQGRGRLYSVRYTLDGILFTQLEHETTWGDSGYNFTGSVFLTVPYLPNLTKAYNGIGLWDIFVPLDISFEEPFTIQRGVDTLPHIPVQIFSVTYGTTTYNQGTDFRVEGTSIIWVGNTPPLGSVYQVSMSYHPFYHVIRSLAGLRNYAHLNWPKTWYLQEYPNLGDVVANAAV